MSLLSLARTAAAKLGTTLNQYKWFNGMDVGPTSNGKSIVLLLYAKHEPPSHHRHLIPKIYENFDVLIIDESKHDLSSTT